MNMSYLYRWILFSLISLSLLTPYRALGQTVKAKIDSLKAVYISESNRPTKLTIALEIIDYYQSERLIDSIAHYSKRAMHLARGQRPSTEAQLHENMADYYYFKGAFTKAVLHSDSGLVVLNKDDDLELAARLYESKGGALEYQEQYDKALESYLKSLHFRKKTGKPELIAMGYLLLANIYDNTGDNEQSITMLNEALDGFWAGADTIGVAGAYGNLCTIYQEMKEYNKALGYCDKAVYYAEQQNYEPYLANNLHKSAELYREMGEMEKARSLYKRTLELDEKADYTFGIAMSHRNLAECFIEEGELDSAFAMLDKGMVYAERSQSLRNLSNYYDLYIEIFQKSSDYEKAFAYLERYTSIRDSVKQLQNQELLTEMKTRFETEQKEQRIILLEQENKINTIRATAVGISSAILLILGGLLYMANQRNHAQELEMIEKDQKLTSYQKELIEADLKSSQLQSEALEKELTNFALQIVEKNEFLISLKDDLAELKRTITDKEAKKGINDLGKKLVSSSVLTTEREAFEEVVQQTCDGFFQRLESEHDALTDREKRLAALVRIGLSSKEIAQIFNIEPKSVDMYRYRLRKKMNLDSDKNLTSYLQAV